MRRPSAESQPDQLQLGPPGVVDQPDGAVAVQDVLAHPLPGGERHHPRAGLAQDHLREVSVAPPETELARDVDNESIFD